MANNEDGRLGVFLLDAIHSSFEDYPPVWPMDVLYIIISSQWNDCHSKSNSYPARALRALGLLLADGAPTVGGGKTF